MGLKQVLLWALPSALRRRLSNLRTRLKITPEQLTYALEGRALSPDEEQILLRSRPRAARTCNVCGYKGPFGFAGEIGIRVDARCLSCGSLERHRLFWKWYSTAQATLGTPVLHFAPEPVIRQRIAPRFGADYRTADLFETDVDLTLDLEAIDLPGASVATVIASHVLEHVDDRKALAELYRILLPGGILYAATPIIEGWEHTYENPSIKSPDERELHFAQVDHVRYYGRDFRDRVLEAGFELVQEITGTPEECVELGLLRGETVFVYRRPASS
ncbi:MAG TPA: methyltransferase domain-containing protein [Microbacteriaceae bacterium]|nr:methyltransferase domain-containing protein [Microbacteriaceae bacterium]